MTPVPILVHTFELHENCADHVLADVGKFVALLADEGLVPGDCFDVRMYRDAISPDALEIVEQLLGCIFCPSLNLDIDSRAHLFHNFMKHTQLFDDKNLRILTRTVLHAYDPEMAFRTLKEINVVDRGVRTHHGLEGEIKSPTLTVISPRFHKAFGGYHGLAEFEKLAFVCPPHYYPQVVWHELLHRMFDVRDCYDLTRGQPNCPRHPRCIMQFDPNLSQPGDEAWCCEHVRNSISKWWESRTA